MKRWRKGGEWGGTLKVLRTNESINEVDKKLEEEKEKVEEEEVVEEEEEMGMVIYQIHQ